MKPISVLFWCPYVNQGGGVRLLLQLVQALAKQAGIGRLRLAAPGGLGLENNANDATAIEFFDLTAPRPASGFRPWLEDGRRVLGVRGTARLKRWLARRFPKAQAEADPLSEASRGCDVVYAFWPHRQKFPITDKPVVCTFQDATFFEFPEILGGHETKAEWFRAHDWLQRSARVIVSSASTREVLVRRFGDHCKAAALIPHAISPLAGVAASGSGGRLRAQLPTRYIVYPAGITSHKNHHTLLLAWSRFRRRKEYPLVLLGVGTDLLNGQEPEWPADWQHSRLVGVVGRSGLRPRDDFYALGYVDDSEAVDLIGGATALVMPSLAEGGGSFPVEEALSLGVPVLCSDIPVLREQLARRSARVLWFDPESPDAIVAAVETLLDDYEGYKTSAQTGMNDPRPTWEQIAARYAGVFLETAGETSKSNVSVDDDERTRHESGWRGSSRGRMGERLRVAINAQLCPAEAGGTASVLVGLLSALGRLEDGFEEYVVVGAWNAFAWLEPHLGPNQGLVPGPQPSPPAPAPAGRTGRGGEVPISDGFYERLAADVIHFPYQSFVLSALPSIYNPHDLQHLHYPQFFSAEIVAWREAVYPVACRAAHSVAVGSDWVREDIIRNYGIAGDRIQVIPWAPPTEACAAPSADVIEATRAEHRLEMSFAFYPAVTWPHKNHLRLLEALAALRDRGVLVPLVCTGYREATHWPRIEARVRELNLDNQVQFLGIVPAQQLRAIYRLARFVVIPTLFEAASAPVFEAWNEGVPVACSTVTSLPQQVGDAALLFDPTSVEGIAAALVRMVTDESLRRTLVASGRRRLQDFSWERTARAYRALYRRAAGRRLTDEERVLLGWDWMGHPNPREERG